MQYSIWLVLVLVSYAAAAKIDPQNLRCLVCRTTFEELNKAVKEVPRSKMVEVGNFRMDADGNTMQHRVPAHRSDVFISDMLEEICKKLDDYVRVTYKSTGKLAIMQLLTEGGMNPEFSKTTFITDDDLNKSLQYYCERIVEENDEAILSLYKDRPEDDVMPDADQAICFKHAALCEPWMLATEEDTLWTPQMEKEYQKVHGPDPYGFSGGMNVPFPEDTGDFDEFAEEEEVQAEDDNADIGRAHTEEL